MLSVRRKDEERYGEYRTKRMILENYDALEEWFEYRSSPAKLSDIDVGKAIGI